MIELLDCTIRDGGYLNKWDFSDKFVEECYRAASESGFDYFEIGFRSSKDDFDSETYGKWIFCDDEEIDEIVGKVQNGCKIAVMSKIDNKNINIHHFKHKNKTNISLVRVLLPYIETLRVDLLKRAHTFCEQLYDLGYEVALNLACIDKYTKKELEIVCSTIYTLNLKYLYFADTYGATNEQILKEKVEQVQHYFSNDYPCDIQIGFHAHNNLQDAFSKSVKSIDYNVKIIDGCMYGLGRGAGNLPSELIIGHMYKNTMQPFAKTKYNILPILEFIDNHLIGYRDRIPERMSWGYNTLYMITGITGCHPSYATEVIDMKESMSISEFYELVIGLLENGKFINYDRKYIQNYVKKRNQIQ